MQDIIIWIAERANYVIALGGILFWTPVVKDVLYYGINDNEKVKVCIGGIALMAIGWILGVFGAWCKEQLGD